MLNSRNRLKNKVLDGVKSVENRLIEISKYIHDHPELGYQEHKASQLLISEFKKYGFRIENPVGGMKTAFRASLNGGKKGGPAIAILTEYDALPELDQAGGHNMIAAAGLGAAIGLSKVLPSLRGTLIVLGCPAEQGYVENAGGKIKLIRSGFFRNVDLAMIVHPSPRYSVWGKNFAREHFKCTFRNGNASARHSNILDSVILTLSGITMLKQNTGPDTVIQYVISKGGVTPSIVPREAEVKIYVRSRSLKEMEKWVRRIKNYARGAALATGNDVFFKKHAYTYSDNIPNLTLTRVFHKNLLELGVAVDEPCDLAKKSLAGSVFSSSDVGNVSRLVPTGTMRLGIGYGGLHTIYDLKKAIQSTVSKKAHQAVIVGARALALSVLDFFTHPELIKESKKELEGYRANGFKHPYPTGRYPRYIA